VSLVLDSSATLAWIYMEERSEAIAGVFDRLTADGAWVPSLWRLEVANVLEMGVRRGRMDAAFRDATLEDLELLPIQTDPDTEKHAWRSTLRLAERYKLTIYDAAYLELAMRRGLPLASLDGELRAAAGAAGVVLLGE
jgi:predicted nucleic acid-binding protein